MELRAVFDLLLCMRMRFFDSSRLGNAGLTVNITAIYKDSSSMITEPVSGMIQKQKPARIRDMEGIRGTSKIMFLWCRKMSTFSRSFRPTDLIPCFKATQELGNMIFHLFVIHWEDHRFYRFSFHDDLITSRHGGSTVFFNMVCEAFRFTIFIFVHFSCFPFYGNFCSTVHRFMLYGSCNITSVHPLSQYLYSIYAANPIPEVSWARMHQKVYPD